MREEAAAVLPMRSRVRRGMRHSANWFQLVRFSVDEGPLVDTKWFLHTRDAHALYERFGFGAPNERAMERRPT